MNQNLEGIDIYDCSFFEVDSSGRLKFISGAFYNRTPDSFKNINEVYDVIRFCMWIIKKESLPDVSKYAAVVFMNRVNSNLQKIERAYRKVLRKKQIKEENTLNKSISTPGKKYI